MCRYNLVALEEALQNWLNEVITPKTTSAGETEAGPVHLAELRAEVRRRGRVWFRLRDAADTRRQHFQV
jgi:hypothetical protein